jgi:dTDP-4-dehydrorhamnose reductase
MKILLSGKNGQLGFELQRALAPLGPVIAISSQDCNFANAEAVRDLVRQVQPDVVVNPAAYTAVDRAESEADLAMAVNAEAVRVLAQESQRLGALMLHYSTDYVYDGTKTDAYREDDAVNPQNVYGRSKLAGERYLQQLNPRHLIFRTSWVVGAHGANFAKTMLRLAAERDSLSVVADQIGAPTSAAWLADVSAQILGRALREGVEDLPFGLYHLTAGGVTNWCDYARYVIAAAQQAGKQLKIDAKQIQAITTADYPTPARRPANSRLDTAKFRRAFGLYVPEWQQGVEHILQQIFSEAKT